MDSFQTFDQRTLVGSGPELLYEVPANFAAIIKTFELVNIGADDDTVTIWSVPDGETVADEWIWRPPTAIEPTGELTFVGSMALEAGRSVWAESDGTSILNSILAGLLVDETPA